MSDAPYRLPLSRAEFEAGLVRGLGRVVQHVAVHGDAGVEDLLRHALLHDVSFDRQCEDSRAPWLHRILTQLPEDRRREHEEAVLETFDGLTEWDYDEFQIVELARHFAAAGHAEARHRFRSKVFSAPSDLRIGMGSDWISLEGLPGLLELAGIVGEDAWDDDERWRRESWVNTAAERDGMSMREVRARLDSEAPQAPGIARLIANVDWESFDRVEEKEEVETPEERRQSWLDSARARFPRTLIEDLLRNDNVTGKMPYPLQVYGEIATDEEREEFRTRLHEEANPALRAKLFALFWRKPLPRPTDDIVAAGASDHPLLQSCALRALGLIADGRIRSLYDTRILNPLDPYLDDVIGLLRENYQEGDEIAVLAALAASRDDGTIHSGFLNLLDVFQGYPARNLSKLAIPESWALTPCSMCRFSAIKYVIQAVGAPCWLIEEALHDCNVDTRDLAERALGLVEGSGSEERTSALPHLE